MAEQRGELARENTKGMGGQVAWGLARCHVRVHIGGMGTVSFGTTVLCIPAYPLA